MQNRLVHLLLLPILYLVCGPATQAYSQGIPEPEYIDSHFCKTFGRGYTKIPGSENCLKVSGMVRLELERNFSAQVLKRENKGLLTIKVKSDTDKGRLRSRLSFEATGDAAHSPLKLEISSSTIGLDKWLAGYTASNWVRYDWGGFNIESGPFGYHKANMLQFEDTIAGIKMRYALEFPEDVEQTMPSLIAHFSKRGKWWSASIAGVVAEVEKGRIAAVKGGITLRLNRIKKGVRLKFQGTFGRDVTGTYLEGERWDFIAAYSHPLAKTITANFTFGTSDNLARNFTVAGNLVWKPFRHFKMLGEVTYEKNRSWGALVRIERRF